MSKKLDSPTGDDNHAANLRAHIAETAGFPAHYLGSADLPGNAEIQKAIEAPKWTVFTEAMERVNRTFKELGRVLQQPIAEWGEQTRRVNARLDYYLWRQLAKNNPDLHVYLRTGSDGVCRVVVRRSGGWQ